MKPFYYSAIVAWTCGLLLAVDFNCCALALSERDKRDNAIAQATQLSSEQIKQIARSITVKVHAEENRGTGVLLSKEGKTYTVVTYASLVERDKSYRIQTADGKTHQATLLIKGDSFADKSLALLQFQTNENYAIANVDSDSLFEGEKSYGAGFFDGNESLVFGTGIGTGYLQKPLAGGYQIGISKTTQAGASGGALLNERGALIGILGRKGANLADDDYVYEDGSRPYDWEIERIRDSRLAIAIDTAIKLKSHSVVTQVDRIAQEITVRIDSSQHGNGSGIIIARQGNTYYALTAAHVVANQDDYKIVTPDGQDYEIDRETVKTFEGVDLAVIPFKSKKSYSVATLADYQIASESPVNDRSITGGSTGTVVFLSGFPDKNSTTPTRKITAGRVVNQESSFLETQNSFSLLEGYELVYSNPSEPGMSGGAVLDRLGRVIGINAAAEGEIEYEPSSGKATEIYLGQSLGVPIRTFLGLVGTGIDSQLLKIETSTTPTPDESGMYSYLEDKNTINDRTFTYKPPSESASAFEWLNWGNYLWRKEQAYADDFDEGKADEAFEKAIQLQPDFYQAYYALGISLEQGSQYELAIAAYDKAIQIQPSFYEAQYKKAEALRRVKKYPEALISIDKAIELNPDDAALYLLRGQILVSLNRYPEAKTAFGNAIDRKPNFFAYYYRAEALSQMGDKQGAVLDYSKAIAINPREASSYHSRGLLYSDLANEKAAMADLDRAIALADPLYTILFSAGRAGVRFKFGDYQGAIAECNEVIKNSNGSLISSYLCRAESYRYLGDYQKALAEYNKMLESIMAKKVWGSDSFDNQALAYSGRARVYAALGNFEKAYADANKAVELQPNDFNKYLARSYCHWVAKDFVSAIADANTAIEIRPNASKAYVLRGTILARQGELEKGLAEIDKALAKNPKFLDAIATKGAMKYEIGKVEESVKLWRIVVKINRDPKYKLALAVALYARGEQREGIGLAKQAISANPNLKNLALFKDFFWGDRLSSDTQKLLASL
jgi:tetratricopeptide (TPR) repeat protein